jgi:hypothetical protein
LLIGGGEAGTTLNRLSQFGYRLMGNRD